jgi:hypothetical protein
MSATGNSTRTSNIPTLKATPSNGSNLARTSLYEYLRVYDWVSVHHKQWLAPKPKGLIPDLSDIADLIWIENELAGSGISPATRRTIEDLKKRALNGDLKQADLEEFRRHRREGDQGLRAFLAALRKLRQRGVRLVNMPPEVISHLDTAIGVLENADVLHTARLDFIGPGNTPESQGVFVS